MFDKSTYDPDLINTEKQWNIYEKTAIKKDINNVKKRRG